MDNKIKRILLFLFGCILLRSILVYVVKIINSNYLPYIGLLLLIPAIGFLYIYIYGLRKTGAEVFGDVIWWNNLRPVHGLLYLMAAVMAVNKSPCTWIILLIDVMIGLIAFILHHLNN